MLEFLAFLGAWYFFWPLTILLLIIAGVSSEQDGHFWAFIATVGLLILGYVSYPSLISIFSSPITLIVLLISYVVIGVTWSVFKWYLSIKKSRNKFIEIKNEFFKEKKLPKDYFDITPTVDEAGNHNKVFYDYLSDLGWRVYYSTQELKIQPEIGRGTTIEDIIRSVRPDISKNKSRVICWGVYWPMSMMWFILNDFITEIIEYIYSVISGKLQNMSNRMFKDVM